MQEKSYRLIVPLLGLMLVLTACASQQPLVTIGPAKGETKIEVKASNFKFQPNNIKAYKGGVLVVRIENISDTVHNFTINNPEGRALHSVPLPPRKTTAVKVDLSEPGTYEFYCDKPFHAAFGMKGRIEVVQ
ncbi:MAG: cupredoxin domain-containing protein [Candidatus Sulfobium sp.]